VLLICAYVWFECLLSENITGWFEAGSSQSINLMPTIASGSIVLLDEWRLLHQKPAFHQTTTLFVNGLRIFSPLHKSAC
jgi:hypothetical protein